MAQMTTTKEIHLSEKAQDFLENYWVATQENEQTETLGESYDLDLDEPTLEELTLAGFLTGNSTHLDLTHEGFFESRSDS